MLRHTRGAIFTASSLKEATMRKSFLPIGTALRVTMLAASAAGMTGCAPPILLSASIASHAVAPVPGDTIGEAQDSTTIELRYFRFSPTVSVVGWMDEDTGYGLRGVVRRDGSLVRDHRLYVITYYAPDVRAFPHATVPSGPLKMTGISRDTYHCYFGDKCSLRRSARILSIRSRGVSPESTSPVRRVFRDLRHPSPSGVSAPSAAAISR